MTGLLSQEVEAAFEFAESSPFPLEETLFEDIYRNPSSPIGDTTHAL